MNRLLFFDDEPNVILALKRQLNKLLLGDEIVGANSGKEAFQFIEKTAFDTIVLDIRVPGRIVWRGKGGCATYLTVIGVCRIMIRRCHRCWTGSRRAC